MDVTNWMLKEGETLTVVRQDYWGRWSRQVLAVTLAQEYAIARVVRRVTDGGRYEVKFISYGAIGSRRLEVSVEAGLPGDGGTLAEVFCRNRLQVFIGPRGGLSGYGKGGKRLKGRDALSYRAMR